MGNDLDPAALTTRIGDRNEGLDQRLSDELDRFNEAATPQSAPQRELTIEVRDTADELAAGLSGWTWGTSAGIAMVWVREDLRRTGLGQQLLAGAEDEARSRGCEQVYVSSFTFQAPGFYERNGYVEFARQPGIPAPDDADVHFRKSLG